VELHAYDLKGGSDFLPLEPVSHRFRVGDDPNDLATLRSDLRNIHADMGCRYKVLRSLPRDVCPEGKITRALADRRELGLFPVVLLIDECQLAFDGDPETVALVTDLGKRGPAAGIIVILATQRVDAQSLPTGISSNAVLRWCFKVTGQVENDMVLGTSAYKAGIRATMFARADQGICYFAGEGADPVIVRTAYLDAPAAEQVVARARAARLAAGLLTGHAAGLDPDPDPSTASLLDHLLEVWPATPEGPIERVWWDELAGRLTEIHPGLYGGWTGVQVSAAAKPHGLKSVQVKRWIDGRQVNRRGLAHSSLAEAVQAREPDQPEQPVQTDDWPQLPAATDATTTDPERTDLR
jgi:S-DNA-T family DNA segregation ATPase FtsK/SpoIIIE